MLRRRRRFVGGHRLLVVAAVLALGASCKREDDLRQDESVRVVVAADKKLAEQEAQLLTSRGALQRRRSSVRDKRAALLTRQLALEDEGTDESARKELEQEESDLVSLEARLVKQEIDLNRKLERLFEQKSGLVAQLDEGNAGTKSLLLARREQGIAQRERDLGRREADLASREKLLAEREQSLAVRQAKLCPGRGPSVVVAAPRQPTERAYGRDDIEPLYRGALQMMRRKGILVADLPAGVDRLVTDTRHAVSQRDYAKAKYAVDQLMAAVRGTRIDRSFIGAKIERLSGVVRRSPLRGTKKSAAERLFREATAHYGDGRFTAANGKLNQIYALIGGGS